MSTRPNYHKDIADNPVQRHERAHIKRERMSWFSRGLYAIAILTMIVPILWGFSIHFHRTLEIVVVILFILNAVAIFAVEMRIMGNSADSMRREFQGRTWDLLILTGVDTWRLVLGKWLGTIRGHRRDVLFLYSLRFVTFLWGMTIYHLAEDGFRTWCWRCESREIATLLDVRLDFSIIPIVAIIFAIYLILEVMLVSSLPMAMSLFRKTRKGAVWASLGLRIAIPVAFMMLLAFVFYELPYAFGVVERMWLDYDSALNIILISIGGVLADNGFILSGLHLDIGSITTNTYQAGLLWNVYMVVHLMGIGLYLLWIWVMLRLAKWAAHRRNVSTPGFIPKVKPKRPVFETIAKTELDTTLEPAPTRTTPKAIIYRCEVLRHDQTKLDIAIYKQSETSPQQIIRFKDVSYFTGMTRWQTTHIAVRTNSNLETFTNQYQVNSNRLPIGSKVYELQSSDTPIHIIATSMQKKEVKKELIEA